jgi:hypothetical protein
VSKAVSRRRRQGELEGSKEQRERTGVVDKESQPSARDGRADSRVGRSREQETGTAPSVPGPSRPLEGGQSHDREPAIHRTKSEKREQRPLFHLSFPSSLLLLFASVSILLSRVPPSSLLLPPHHQFVSHVMNSFQRGLMFVKVTFLKRRRSNRSGCFVVFGLPS